MTPEQLQKMQQLEQQLAQVTAERDALQKRVDGALVHLRLKYNDKVFSTNYILQLQSEDIKRAIKILTGEGG